MKVEMEKFRSELILKVSGRIDATDAPNLKKILLENADPQDTHVIDIANVAYVSDEGFQAILFFDRMIKSISSKFAIKGMNEQVRRKMNSLGLSSILPCE